ncbi:insecticidal toxin protein [Erwinia sp. Ejp617]|nr:insecticidal toxin protein [Erwinia sp. Ejp617]
MVRNNPVTLKDLEGKMPVLPFTFESEVQRAVKGAIHYMKIALNILEANDSAAIAEISDSLYGNHRETTLNAWKEGLKLTISIASEFHVKRNLNINKEKEWASVAHVESQELSSYRKYYQPVARIKNSDMSKSEMKRSISEVNINYQSERNEKYLNISKGLFRENVERFGKAHAPTMLIHEFSHAANNTGDYMYAVAFREKPNEISYSNLHALQEGTLSDNLKCDYMDYNTDPKKAAMNNADTFAHASSLLYFSSKSSGAESKRYKEFLIQKERNFARPSTSR